MGTDAFMLIERKGEIFTVVLDVEDYERLKGYNWFIERCSAADRKPKYYAKRNGPGRGKKTYMHREIAGALPGLVVDHRDGNGLNNRKDNFKVTTQPDNARRQNHAVRRRYDNLVDQPKVAETEENI